MLLTLKIMDFENVHFFHGEYLDKKMQMEDVDVWWWEEVQKICCLCVFFVVNL